MRTVVDIVQDLMGVMRVIMKDDSGKGNDTADTNHSKQCFEHDEFRRKVGRIPRSWSITVFILYVTHFRGEIVT